MKSLLDAQQPAAPGLLKGGLTAERHSAAYWALSDTWTLIGRSLEHIFRNLDQLLGLTVQPLMFLLLFRYVFGGAIDTGGVAYVNFLVAGILVQMAAFGATTTSFSVATDVKKGVIDRFKSLPMTSSAVLTGHVVADLARNVISSTIMIVAAFPLGFRPVAGWAEWLQILGIILLFTLAISWLSAIMGLLARSIETVQWMSFLIIFPLTFASAAFVPTSTMPHALRLFAENQPVTHVIEAIRALMNGRPVGNHAWLSVVWSLAITVVAVPLAAYLFRHRTVAP